MAFISKSTIADVNTRLDAVSVIGEYVRLEQKSGRWWGRCPFHGGGQEKTPSFKVDPDLKMYHCFGCSKGGSVISFVMEMDKLTYPQAIKSLADKMGIEIIYEEGHGESEKEDSFKVELYELYKRLTVTFQHFLSGKQGTTASNYIKQRGISDEMVLQFKLGYSPPERNFLHEFLKKKGYSDEFLAKSGLFSSRYKTIPLFSGRLMFPIEDRQGRIVAFGGRALPDIQGGDANTPKYINSPETEIYKKGQTLFAIDNAKPLMRQTKTVYLAEGYMDVIALHQAGITNSVAPLGTAFTDEQALWLRRWADSVILLLDNDEAGQKAAAKAILTCRRNSIACSVADIRTGLISESVPANNGNFKDPADILKEFGPQILKNILKFTINDFEYFILRGKDQYNRTGNVNKAAEFMFPYLEALDSEIDRSDCITRVADILKIDRSAVQKEYSKWRHHAAKFPAQDSSHPSSEKSNEGKRSDFAAHNPDRQAALCGSEVINQTSLKSSEELQICGPFVVRKNIELNLLANIALNMELYTEFRAACEIRDFDDRAAKEIFISLEECYKHDESVIDSLLSRINNEQLRDFIINSGTSGEFKGDPRKFMEDGINFIRIKRYKKRITEINSLMRESERKPEYTEPPESIDELLAEKKLIDEKIRKLEGR